MLLDQGADVNSIYRSPRNVVMTPLDCALNKGYRSTAKFLQLHSGLPASKLRLSGRNPNAINDQELVKPLHSINKSKSDTKISSGDGSRTSTRCEKNCECNTSDRCRKRHPKLKCCLHIRSSSCETHIKGNGSSEINRSKSNIELRRTRRTQHRTSRSQRRLSSITYSSSSSSTSESECFNCKVKRRDVTKKNRRSRAKSTPRKKCDNTQSNSMNNQHDRSSSDEEWSRKSVTKTHYQKSTTKKITKVAQTKKSNDAKSSLSQAENCEPATDELKANTLNVDDQSKMASSKEEVVVSENENNVTTTEVVNQQEINAKPTEHIIEVNVSSPDSGQPDGQIESSNIIIATAEVHSNNVPECQSGKENSENTDAQQENQEEGINQILPESYVNPEYESVDKKESSLQEHPKNEADPPQTTKTGHELDGNNESNVANKSNDLLATQINKNEEDNIKDSSKLNELLSPTNKDENLTANKSDEQTDLNTLSIHNETNTDSTSNGNDQESVNRLPTQLDFAEKPNPDSITAENRKSSFTVLPTDESIGDNRLDLNSDFQNDSIDDGPSFEVLELNQNNSNIDDTKTSDDDHDLTVSADEDEPSAVNAILGRKRVKTRAQSSSVRRGLDRSSHDQDSGFEPSPRATRTKIPSPQFLSGVVKSRRLVIGNKSNPVDMTTVTHSMNMNIRR